MRRVSTRQKQIKKVEALFRKLLKQERGAVCEICGRHEQNLPYALSLFHILRKGVYPKLRFHRQNVLLVCWTPHYNKHYCHDAWHLCNKDEPEYRRVREKLQKLRGEAFEDDLKIIDKISQKLSMMSLKHLERAFKQELE